MDIVYSHGEATAAAIRQSMQEAPTPGTVRKLLQILEAKGHLKHSKSGREHVYQPAQAKHSAARRALQGLLDTFFGGSLREAIATHLTGSSRKLPEEELQEIARLIRDSRKETKNKGSA